jgi:RNA polymerase sigma factor (sigma-70 family)
MTIEDLWKQYEGMVAKLAWSWVRTTGLEFEDLFSAGKVSFVRAVQSFDEDRASFSTWLYGTLRLHLRAHVETEVRRRGQACPMVTNEDGEQSCPEIPVTDHGFRYMLLNEWVKGLSEDAQLVVSLVLNSPVEAFRLTGSEPPKMMRGCIVRGLKRKGWSQKKRWDVMRELRCAVATI